MAAIVDINRRAVVTNDEYELVDSPGIAARIGAALEVSRPDLRCLLTPPIYYSLANGIADNRAVNDALLAAAATRPGWRACGVAEPKYGAAAFAEIERLATLGAAGVVWSPRAQGVFGNDHSLAELCRHAHGLGLVSMIHSAPYSVNEGLWRLWALAAGCPGVPLLLIGACESWENIQHIREHNGGGENLFYDLSLLSESWDLDALAADVGAERLLFGSGGADLFERTLGIVERSGLSAQARDAILSGNAGGLFA
jgi:predicted TIM-barrel fold metal-dependent hydrolase